jgi:hypothetical protein
VTPSTVATSLTGGTEALLRTLNPLIFFKLLAAGSAKAYRDVVGHHLHGNHRQCLALGWIDLA